MVSKIGRSVEGRRRIVALFFFKFFLSRVELVVVETTAGRPCLQLTVKEDVTGRLPLLVAGGIGCAVVGGRDCTRSTLQTNGENN